MRAQFNEDIHSYDFPDGITITFEKLREEKTGLTAKGIYYFVRSPDDFDVLDSGNINFDASPTRKTQAKTLFGKYSSISLDEWHNRLLTVQRESEKYFYNGGVDVFDLSTVEPDLDSNPALLAPFIAKSGITLIYADSSAGKSMFVLAAALSVATGIQFLEKPPEEQGNVLYLDYEDTKETLAERSSALLAGQQLYEFPADKFFYASMEKSLANQEIFIRKLVRDHDIKLVIIDSLSLAAGDPTEVTNVHNVITACRRLKRPVVLIHHISNEAVKEVKARNKRPYGSTFSRAWARKLWLIEKESTLTGPIIRLTNTKVNNGIEDLDRVFTLDIINNTHSHMISARYAPASLLDFAEARNQTEAERESAMSAKTESVNDMATVREEIDSFLKRTGEPKTCKQITDDLNEWRGKDEILSEEAVRVEVKRGEGKNMFEVKHTEQVNGNTLKFWGIKEKGEAT